MTCGLGALRPSITLFDHESGERKFGHADDASAKNTYVILSTHYYSLNYLCILLVLGVRQTQQLCSIKLRNYSILTILNTPPPDKRHVETR